MKEPGVSGIVWAYSRIVSIGPIINFAEQARFPVIHPSWGEQIVEHALHLDIRAFLKRRADCSERGQKLLSPTHGTAVTNSNTDTGGPVQGSCCYERADLIGSGA